MYSFLLGVWVCGTVDEQRLKNYVPKFITADQLNEILDTPQQ